MKKIAKNFIVTLLSAAALAGTTSAFAADLSPWAMAEYHEASSAGLVSYSIVSKNLKDNITREEFCELAVNLYKNLTNEALIEPSVSPFVDTTNMAVAQAYCYGIVSGTGTDTFNPDRFVTRQEMAKMLVSTLTASGINFELSGSNNGTISAYGDADSVSTWARAAVNTMLDYSLMNGINEYEFGPQGSTTREQAIASVNRSFNQFGEKTNTVTPPSITLPEDGAELEGTFDISWTPVSDTAGYHIIIKDANGTAVNSIDVYDMTSVAISEESNLRGGQEYSIVVGAVLNDGTEIYSLPVDFKYKSASSHSTYSTNNALAQSLIDSAAKYLGVPYVWGGSTPSGFDCSGFVQYVCRENGISIPRVADDQLHSGGTRISKSELQPGDLVFFGSGDYASHVGMYVGDGTMIHAPSTGKNIMYTSIESDYYVSRYIGAVRVY